MVKDFTSASRQLYYKPSGRFTVLGVFGVLIFGGVAGLLSGAAYGYLTELNPFIFINFLATMGFGFAVGMANVMGVNLGKIRAPMLGAALGLLTGIFAHYAGWVVWSHALLGNMGQDIWVYHPLQLWTLAQLFAEKGVWTLSGTAPTGALLWALWGIEALVVVGMATWFSYNAASDPFCEECDAWTSAVFTGVPLGDADAKALVTKLEAGNIHALSELGRAEGSRFTTLDMSVCPNCKQAGFLNMSSVELVPKKKDQVETKTKAIVTKLCLSPSAIHQVEKICGPILGEV